MSLEVVPWIKECRQSYSHYVMCMNNGHCRVIMYVERSILFGFNVEKFELYKLMLRAI